MTEMPVQGETHGIAIAPEDREEAILLLRPVELTQWPQKAVHPLITGHIQAIDGGQGPERHELVGFLEQGQAHRERRATVVHNGPERDTILH